MKTTRQTFTQLGQRTFTVDDSRTWQPKHAHKAERGLTALPLTLTLFPLRGTNTHTQNLKTVSSPSFFLRIAGMSDETEDESRKEQLSVLADNVVATLEAVMQRTEERMDGAAELVQGLIASAAEENGEFIVPLKPERVKFMRNKVALARAQIDEGILSTVFAYMKKANEVQRQPYPPSLLPTHPPSLYALHMQTKITLVPYRCSPPSFISL